MLKPARTALLGLVLLNSARAWAPLNAENEEGRGLKAAWRWTAPSEGFTSNVGLGGGITYRIDDSFCEMLLPQFNDDLFSGARIFVTCKAVKSAVTGAFNEWSSNHPAVHFVDAGMDGCDDGGMPEGCLPVEIVISAQQNVQNRNQAAYVRHYLDTNSSVRKTNGVGTESGARILAAELNVNADVCWYMDDTFCWGFHRFKAHAGAAAALGVGQALLAIFWFVALFSFAYEIGFIVSSLHHISISSTQEEEERGPSEMLTRRTTMFALHRMLETRNTRSYLRSRLPAGSTRAERLSELAYNVANRHSPAVQTIVWLLLLFPPIFYWHVFLPCWACFDFSAAMAHEVGHVLGLDHPDVRAETSTNFMATQPMGPGTCRREESVPTPTDVPPAGSVMLQFTQNSQHGCLAPDDLTGLNFLYPSCEGTLSAVRCNAQQSNVGWLRLAVAIVLPTLVALSVTLLLTFYVKRRNSDRVREMRAELKDVTERLQAAKQQVKDEQERRARPVGQGMVQRLTRGIGSSSSKVNFSFLKRRRHIHRVSAATEAATRMQAQQAVVRNARLPPPLSPKDEAFPGSGSVRVHWLLPSFPAAHKVPEIDKPPWTLPVKQMHPQPRPEERQARASCTSSWLPHSFSWTSKPQEVFAVQTDKTRSSQTATAVPTRFASGNVASAQPYRGWVP